MFLDDRQFIRFYLKVAESIIKSVKVELLLSPMSLKKAGLGSPPKKKPKLWKSKWQLATLGQ